MFDIETIQAMNREEAERLGTPWGEAAEHKFTPACHGKVYDGRHGQGHIWTKVCGEVPCTGKYVCTMCGTELKV